MTASESPTTRTVTIEVTSENGITETFMMTAAEFNRWEVYADRRPDLLGRIGYGPILRMFLTNDRLAHKTL